MMKKNLILLLAGLLSSCATITHRAVMNINVSANVDSVQINQPGDSSHWHSLPATLSLLRGKDDLTILVKKDSITTSCVLRSKLSSAFWVGNLFSGGLIGYAIDINSPKIYTYPSEVRMDYKDGRLTKMRTSGLYPPAKGQLNLTLSLPEGNFFYLNKGNAYGASSGFIGVVAKGEYYFTDSYCFSVGIGTLFDFLVPFPAAVDYYGDYDTSRGVFATLGIGKDYRRFHLNAGLQCNQTVFNQHHRIEDVAGDVHTYWTNSTIQNNLGFSCSGYYKLTRVFSIGLNYLPSFVGWSSSKWTTHYGHMIFLDLNFNFNLGRFHR